MSDGTDTVSLPAFSIQVKDAMDEMVKVITWLETTYRIWRPTPINSIVTKGCLETGKDADLAIYEADFTTWRTMIGGQWVYG